MEKFKKNNLILIIDYIELFYLLDKAIFAIALI